VAKITEPSGPVVSDAIMSRIDRAAAGVSMATKDQRQRIDADPLAVAVYGLMRPVIDRRRRTIDLSTWPSIERR